MAGWSGRTRLYAVVTVFVAVLAALAATFVSSPVAADADSARAQAIADAEANVIRCQAAIDVGGLTAAERNEALRCVRINAAALRNLLPGATPTATLPPPTTNPGTTPPPTTTAPPVTTTSPPPTSPAPCPRTTPHVPGGPDGFGGCWPDASTTGVPAGTTLTPYTGPCVITTPVTIDAKTVSCTLDIRTQGVLITRSKIDGSVYLDRPGIGSVTITDTEIDCGGPTNSCLGKSDFIAMRLHVHGGNRSVWCEYNCTLADSYAHGQAPDPSGQAHEGGVRMGDGSTIRHNAIACDAPDFPPDAGCSADLTGYGDFAPIRNNLLERNLFMASTGGACAYGGSSGDDGSKPYGAQAANIRFVDNVFQRGPGGKCGFYFPITDFDSTRPGNSWINNRWDSGEILPPAN